MSRKLEHKDMLESLRDELSEVEANLADLAALQARQKRLQSAIKAMEGLTAPQGLSEIGAVNATSTGLPPVPGTVQLHLVSPPRTLLEAAERVLREAKKPLHIKEIVSRMQGRGFFPTKPYEQMRATMVSQMNRKAEDGTIFTKIVEQPSTYGLQEWVSK